MVFLVFAMFVKNPKIHKYYLYIDLKKYPQYIDVGKNTNLELTFNKLVF